MQGALSRLNLDRAGATAIEYAFIAALISIAAASIFMTIGSSLSGIFQTVASSL